MWRYSRVETVLIARVNYAEAVITRVCEMRDSELCNRIGWVETSPPICPTDKGSKNWFTKILSRGFFEQSLRDGALSFSSSAV